MQLSPEGKPIPAGAKAFRLNVLYDILRSAAQSGEYEVDSTRANGQATAQQAAGDEAEVPAEDAAAITPPPDSAASGNSEEVPAGKDSRDDLSTDLTLNSASGLSEAMAYTKRVMVRAEVCFPCPLGSAPLPPRLALIRAMAVPGALGACQS